MGELTIRLAAEDDLARIVAISNAAADGTANFATEPEPVDAWRETWRATASSYPWLVACPPSGEVVGFAKAGPHRARGAYRWTAELSVYLDAAWHGRGVGTALYEVLIPILRAQGYVMLLAGITAGHVASERLHVRAGFVRCGTFHRAGWKLGAWHDVGYWELTLATNAAPGPIQPVADVWQRASRARVLASLPRIPGAEG